MNEYYLLARCTHAVRCSFGECGAVIGYTLAEPGPTTLGALCGECCQKVLTNAATLSLEETRRLDFIADNGLLDTVPWVGESLYDIADRLASVLSVDNLRDGDWRTKGVHGFTRETDRKALREMLDQGIQKSEEAEG